MNAAADEQRCRALDRPRTGIEYEKPRSAAQVSAGINVSGWKCMGRIVLIRLQSVNTTALSNENRCPAASLAVHGIGTHKQCTSK